MWISRILEKYNCNQYFGKVFCLSHNHYPVWINEPKTLLIHLKNFENGLKLHEYDW